MAYFDPTLVRLSQEKLSPYVFCFILGFFGCVTSYLKPANHKQYIHNINRGNVIPLLMAKSTASSAVLKDSVKFDKGSALKQDHNYLDNKVTHGFICVP